MRRTDAHTTNVQLEERTPGGRTLGRLAVGTLAAFALFALLARAPALAMAGAFVAGTCLGAARERR